MRGESGLYDEAGKWKCGAMLGPYVIRYPWDCSALV